MDNKSATTAEAAPAVIEATTHLQEVNRETKGDLEKDKRDVSEKKISDVMEILQGLVGRLQKMEEQMESRFKQMEEKVDCRLQQIEGKVDLLISSIKAEADNMSVDGSYSDDEEPAKKKSEADTKTPKEEVAPNLFKPFQQTLFSEKESDNSYKPFTFNNGGGPSIFGRLDEERSGALFSEKESGSLFKPFNGGGLFGDGGRLDEEHSGTFFNEKENDIRFNPFSGDFTSLFVGGRFSGGRCGGQGLCQSC